MFATDPDYCETCGHELLTGATVGEQAYRAMAPRGRAIFKVAPFTPSHEEPDHDYPLRFTTGRTAYHFHTRTKTARAVALNRAAPSAWVELSPEDADPLGIGEGDIVRVVSRRGAIVVPARIGDIAPGSVFAPFHYGYWDSNSSAPGDRPPRTN